jgi:hypothetical protein
MDSRAFLAGAALGASAAFIFDPDRGRRRRALARDKAISASRLTRDAIDTTVRDASNRARGIAAATRGRVAGGDADDATLVERVRAKLGRASSHPRAIEVQACEGEVTLCGPVLASEMNAVLATAAGVRGVQSVINQLDAHESDEGVPSLQGEGRAAGPSLDLLQNHWAPATRALVAMTALAATGVAAAYARR